MPFPLQVDDLLSARAWTVFGNQAAVNTFNYRVATITGGAINDEDVAVNLDAILSTYYKGLMAIAAEYRGVQVYYRVRAAGLPAPVQSIAGAGPGLQANPVIPTGMAAIMKYHTAARGPGGRGRVYIPFLSGSEVDTDGTPVAGVNTALDNLAADLLTPLVISAGGSSATLIWGLLRRLPGPTVLYDIRDMIAGGSADKFGQMHKRGNYGRANSSPI